MSQRAPLSSPRRTRTRLVYSLSITAACLTTTSILFYFIIRKWWIQQQESLRRQRIARERIRRLFVRTQSDSVRTSSELLGVFGIVLDRSGLDIQEVFHELKRCVKPGGGNDDNERKKLVVRSGDKADLWMELEMKSLRKFVVLVYSISCLILLTRLQLNIVARREYLESSTRFEIEETLEKQYSIRNWFLKKLRFLKPAEVDNNSGFLDQRDKLQTIQANEQAFLSLSWWLINKGWTQFDKLAEQAISQEFSNVSPRDTIKFSEFNTKMRNVFNALNSLIFTDDEEEVDKSNNNNNNNFKTQLKSLLIPDDSILPTIFKQSLPTQTLTILTDHNFDDTLLRMFIDETRRCIDSEATVLILDSLVNESLKYAAPLLESKVRDKLLKKKGKGKAKKLNGTSTSSIKHNELEASTTDNPEIECEMGVYVVALKDICNEFLYDSEYITKLNEVGTLEDLSVSVFGNF